MTKFTETDFRLLFFDREQLSGAERFDEWLATEFLEVRTDGPQPGVWMDVARIGRMAQMHSSEKKMYLRQHPRHDLSAPVLPFPFDMADFLALMGSDCFKHSSARWPTDEDMKEVESINPRTKTLMMELQGHMLPMPQVVGDVPPSMPPAAPAEALPALLQTLISALADRSPAAGPAQEAMPDDDAAPAAVAPAPEVAAVAENGAASSGVLRRSTKTERRDTLDPVIELAKSQCKDATDTAEVWTRLRVLAFEEHPPFLAVTPQGLKYMKFGERSRYFTRDALNKRLHPEKRRKRREPPQPAA